jgi:hypothetical protein
MISWAIAQRRKIERQHVQAIIEIRGKALSAPVPPGFLRGANHAHINMNFMIFPTRRKVRH